MQIWIDADACPAVVKDIIFRAAERLQIQTFVVVNRLLRTPPSRFIRAIQVPSGFDVADAHIVDTLAAGDRGDHRRQRRGRELSGRQPKDFTGCCQ